MTNIFTALSVMKTRIGSYLRACFGVANKMAGVFGTYRKFDHLSARLAPIAGTAEKAEWQMRKDNYLRRVKECYAMLDEKPGNTSDHLTTEGEMDYPTEFNNGNTMNVNPCRVTLTTTAAEFARVRAVAVKALEKTAGVEFYGSITGLDVMNVAWAVGEGGEAYWIIDVRGASSDSWKLQEFIQDEMQAAGIKAVVRTNW